MILRHWFWPWQIYFDEDIKSDVINFTKQLTIREQKKYEFMIDFFSDFFTFQMLIDYITEHPDKKEAAIQKAKKDITKVTNIPNSMRNDFVDIISKQPKEIQNDLLFILDSAIKSKNSVNYKKYYKKIFGAKLFDEIVKNVNNYTFKSSLKFDSAKKENVQTIHKNFIDYINLEKFRNKWQGIIPNYSTKLKNGMGYGEYWDEYFFDEYKNNTLVLFNNDYVTDNDILYTLFHEVYPGHGNFFEIIKQNKNNIDLGASLLIEGWATFCELSIGLNREYELYYENKYYNFLKCAFNNSYDNLDDYEIYKMVNYPLFKENYYMGAFALKLLLKDKNCEWLYKKFKNNNITDCFFAKLSKK
ncbi:MAG TPA: hypothetical protein DCO89_01755 [Clostridiales bacterium]|nr:hypothetical protein [Clostridiales bacterium]